MKKLIAYSSVAHMGFVTLGIFADDVQGVQGAHLPDAEPRRRLGARCSCASASSTTACTRARSRATAASSTACRPMPRCSWCSCWPRSACRAPAASSASSWSCSARSRSTPGRRSSRRPALILGAAYMLYLYRRVIFGELMREDAAQHPRPQPARDGGVRAAGGCWCCGWASIRSRSSTSIAGLGRQPRDRAINAARSAPPPAHRRREPGLRLLRRHARPAPMTVRRCSTPRSALPGAVPCGCAGDGAADARRVPRRRLDRGSSRGLAVAGAAGGRHPGAAA